MTMIHHVTVTDEPRGRPADPHRWIAAIGTDGRTAVVWGLGHSEGEAMVDAVRWIEGENVREATALVFVQADDLVEPDGLGGIRARRS